MSANELRQAAEKLLEAWDEGPIVLQPDASDALAHLLHHVADIAWIDGHFSGRVVGPGPRISVAALELSRLINSGAA